LFLRIYYPSVWEDELWSKHNLYDTHFSTGAVMINTDPEIGLHNSTFHLVNFTWKSLLPQ